MHAGGKHIDPTLQDKVHAGGKHIDPTLQDKVLLPSDFAEHICHVGFSHDAHSIIQSGLIPGGTMCSSEVRRRIAQQNVSMCYFTAKNCT